MAKQVVLQIQGAPRSLTGRLQRLLLEVAPGTFVGKLPAPQLATLWEAVTENSTSAIFVLSDKSEFGFSVACHGDRNRKPIDNFGIDLIQYEKHKQTSK